MALIGDPGLGKSQLLKQVASITPRGVYTTGKGSSGVGLTAAILKDPVTNELSLEGGALVMADMGVCCIDEFDKMEEYDRTAIHEVMEQQTISIAKAGITTTLNARTSILAAANPLYGRYNKSISLHQNINLRPALLSRFDVIFLLLDTPDSTLDDLMAKHICFVHQHSKAPKQEQAYFSPEKIRAYVSYCKKFSPTIPTNVQQFIVKSYVQKRKEYLADNEQGFQYTTPRTLLGIIRLSQALARIHFRNTVELSDIDEALRIMQVSQESVMEVMDVAPRASKDI